MTLVVFSTSALHLADQLDSKWQIELYKFAADSVVQRIYRVTTKEFAYFDHQSTATR